MSLPRMQRQLSGHHYAAALGWPEELKERDGVVGTSLTLVDGIVYGKWVYYLNHQEYNPCVPYCLACGKTTCSGCDQVEEVKRKTLADMFAEKKRATSR